MLKFLKYAFIAASALMATAAVSACDDDDNKVAPLPTEFKVSASQMLFLKGAGTETLYIESPAAPQVSADASWLTLTNPELNGQSRRVYAVTVSAAANTEFDNRTAQITVTSGAQTATVSVVQSNADGIAVVASTATAPAEGGEFTITVKSTSGYTVALPEWIHQKNARSLEETSLTFVAALNASGSERTGEIVFTHDIETALTAKVTVTQASVATSTTESATAAAAAMYAGINLGNTMEATGGETAWQGYRTDKALVDYIKSVGFNALRIPCSWNQYLEADEAPYTIKADWMNRVKEVVDYCISNDMYAILNVHWDGGWLECNVKEEGLDAVLAKEEYIWKQIATAFGAYGERLIFAGNNEMRQDENWGMPNAGNVTALNKINQKFIDVVRATGGNNATRNLVVQSWCCNSERLFDSFTLPTDPADGHLMVEMHYYEPFFYSHKQDDPANQWTLWGYRKGYFDRNDGQEDAVDRQFARLKAKFADAGIPVIMGEYGAIVHNANTRECESQQYYFEYITKAAKDNGIVPFVWDVNGNFGVINRAAKTISNQYVYNGIMAGAAAGKYPF